MIFELLKSKMFKPKKDDKRVALLNSIKPFISEQRQKSIDSISEMLGIVSMIETMQKGDKKKSKKYRRKPGDKV